MAKPKTTGRSYSHKMYMNTTGYPEAIGRPGDKDYDAYRKRPHSDDKKPYYSDEYPEMEHFWTPRDPPNFVPPGMPDDPRIPPMNPNQPPDIEGGPDDDPDHTFTGCIFGVPKGPPVVGNGETTYSGIGFLAEDPITRLYVNYGPAFLLIDAQTLNRCLSTWEDVKAAQCLVSAQVLDSFDPDDYHKIGDDYFPVQVVAVTLAGFMCTWDFMATNCPPLIEFAWDDENSATVIGQEAAVSVFVEGGTTPFQWEVSGTGYTLGSSKTSGRQNTLYANASACGTATITVTDACDDVVEGQITNTEGRWAVYPDTCGLRGAMSDPDSYYTTPYGRLYDTIQVGGQKQTFWQYWSFGGEVYYDSESDCWAERMNLCSGSHDPCLSFPSHHSWGGIFGGEYDLCPGSYKMVRECVSGYWWTSRVATVAATQIKTYSEWVCD